MLLPAVSGQPESTQNIWTFHRRSRQPTTLGTLCYPLPTTHYRLTRNVQSGQCVGVSGKARPCADCEASFQESGSLRHVRMPPPVQDTLVHLVPHVPWRAGEELVGLQALQAAALATPGRTVPTQAPGDTSGSGCEGAQAGKGCAAGLSDGMDESPRGLHHKIWRPHRL